MSALETTFLSEDPSPEEIKARCNDPAVKEYLRLDTMLCSKEKEISPKVSRPKLAEKLGPKPVRAGAGNQRKNRIAGEFEAEGDIIFAYQLVKIKPKGWSKEKTPRMNEHEHRQAFLGDEERKEEDVESEIEAYTAEDLAVLRKAQVVGIDGAAVAYELPRGRR